MNEITEQEWYDLQVATLVVQQRVYDVLMALLENDNPEMARKLYDLHEKGMLVSPDIVFQPADTE